MRSRRKRSAREIGYPVLLKAAAGGGGKGMRRVDSEGQLEEAMSAAAREAESSFGSGEVYLEKLIEKPRHIEVQVLGDEHGHLIHLGERECSIQRRHQKVVEESPSPLVMKSPELRQRIGEAAGNIARAAGYSNAGTLEFLADQEGNFYFLEMNTRLQVEHPVTELVTGLDLVHWQIRIASGEKLDVLQNEVTWTGSAMECRIYAEDPGNNFFPSPGRIQQYVEPGGPGVRIDGGVYAGWTVPIDYDPLLAKLVVWADTRENAIRRMRRAVSEYHIAGITTNLDLFAGLMSDEAFVRGDLHTGLLGEFMASDPRVPAMKSSLWLPCWLPAARGEALHLRTAEQLRRMANHRPERLATVKLRVDMEGREHLLELQRKSSDSGFKITGAFNAEGICSIEEVSPDVFSS